MKLKAKHVVFLLIGLATLYVLNHNERFVIEPEHPVWQRYEAFKWVLLPHAIFGSITLLSAPFQFSDRLRQRFPKAHRIMGRLYVLGVLADGRLHPIFSGATRGSAVFYDPGWC